MQIEEYGGHAEKSIVIALIVSTEVLARLSPHWEKDSLRADSSNLVAQWCVDYYGKHQIAPGKEIESLFQVWAETTPDSDNKKTIERLLSQLSRKYESLAEDINVLHTVDLATTHFNNVRLERLAEDVQNRIKRGDTAEAIKVAEGFRRIKLAAPAYIDPFRDKDAQRLAMERRQNVLIRYDGGVGEFFGDELSEDSFVAFLAPMKVGKSFFMQDLAWTAVRQCKKVAYFQVGDMTKDQILRRFQKRAARRPIKPGVVQWPITLVPGADGLAQVEFEDRIYDTELTVDQAQAAWGKLVRKHKTQRLRLSCHPSQTVCINDIRSILEEWDREGWKAQIVIIDYADNLGANNPKMHELKQVEDTWTYMRQISEIRKCLVVTATQVNKEGFDTWIMTKKNFSRNKMIMAIVTGFVGINQTDEERSKQLFRLNWIVRRDDKFSEYRCCYVASALGIGQAVVLSAFP